MSTEKTYEDTLRLSTPLSREDVRRLRAGDNVLLSGTVYTARDAAHQRLLRAQEAGEAPPVDFDGQIIYYCGPAPAPPGRPIGSCGPTSSARMGSAYLELTLSLGVVATIGKGNRSREARRVMVRHGAAYLAAVGGVGALLAGHVTAARVVAYEDLGPEAIHELELRDFPLIVAYDSVGGTVFAGEEPLATGGEDES